MISGTQDMIVFDKLSFSYEAGHDVGGVCDIDLTIKRGEVVLLCGSSGCGKTTLTRLINGLIPHYFEGKLTGSVRIDGKDASQCELYHLAGLIGSVFQNPRNQFFTVNTTSELAFCSENLGVEKTEIHRRIQEVAAEMEMQSLLGRDLFKLSGGQKQQIACASVSVASPDVFVLDEPSSNLDMKANLLLMKQIEIWKSQGKTVVIAEHRLHYLRNLVDRVVMMEEGKIVEVFRRDEIVDTPITELAQKGLRVFSLDDLKEGRQNASSLKADTRSLRIENMSFAYKRQSECLQIEECNLPENAIIACIGHNGAGKSTFARCLCGLEKKAQGSLAHYDGDDCIDSQPLKRAQDHAFLVMQDVNHQLFTDSVLEEVMISFSDKKTKEEASQQALKILSDLNLAEFKDAHPMSLSGGQKQRVAIASAVASDRACVVFDEPTSGLDLKHMRMVAKNMEALQRDDRMLLVITHDPELILQCCTHVACFEERTISEVYKLDERGISRMLDFFIEAFNEKAAPVLGAECATA